MPRISVIVRPTSFEIRVTVLSDNQPTATHWLQLVHGDELMLTLKRLLPRINSSGYSLVIIHKRMNRVSIKSTVMIGSSWTTMLRQESP